MAKEVKKEVEKEEEKKPLVQVEMTETEKADFVKFMADKAEKEEAKKSNEGLVEMNLRTSHMRNGKRYGPGRVTVPELIAGSLEVAEQKWVNGRIKVHEGGTKMIEILGHGVTRVRKMPADTVL